MRPFPERISKAVFIMVLAGFVVLSANAQEKHAFSASEAVEYALNNSAQVKNALVDIKIQEQTNREITSAALPQASGNIGGTYYLEIPTNLIPGEFFGQPAGTYVPVQFGTKYNAQYGATLEQLLFDGQVFVGLQARSASMDYARQNVAVTRELIKANVYKIYYQLVVGKRQITTIDANITRSEKLLHDTKALYENGFAEKLDVDKVSVSLSNLRTEKMKVENQLRTGYLGLKYLMGMPMKDELVLTDSLEESSLKDGLLYDSVRYDDRKEYQLLQTVEKLNQYNIKRYRMSYIPTLSLTGSYTRNAQRNEFNFFKKGEPWFTAAYIGLNINIPIFDGFAKDARIKTARLELQKTQNNLAYLRNQIELQVDSSLISIRNALVTLDEQSKNMKLAEDIYNQTKIKYENGLGSTLEISNAEAELKTAQNNYYAALYDAIVARIDYLKALGKL